MPKRLFNLFSGVSNATSQVANARIQFAFDLLNERVTYLCVDPYSSNDLKKACCLHVKKGDLVLRDRGYFCEAEIIRISEAAADFIYRYKHNITYLDLNTGKPVNLLVRLKQNPTLDIMVRLKDEHGPVVRLVANAINEELANRRRQKLKETASSKPSKECLELLSWSIFITSIKQEQLNYKAIQQLYMLRWRVEILFKALKSNLNLSKIHTIPANQLHFIIYARLIVLILITRFIYLPARSIIKKHFNKEISTIKLTAFITENPMIVVDLIEQILMYDNQPGDKLKALAKYCCYDVRKKRSNYDQFAKEVLLS